MRAALVACAAALWAGCSSGSPCGATEAKVTRVIDGDTVEIEGGVKIRYLLIDTPEISGGGDCYGDNARQANSDLVLNKTITLSYDEQCTDNFGRSLAYVTVDGIDVNARLVMNGYACVLFIPPNGASRVDEFNALELDAKNARRGLWSACTPLPPACT